jgi:hypothetical protein
LWVLKIGKIFYFFASGDQGGSMLLHPFARPWGFPMQQAASQILIGKNFLLLNKSFSGGPGGRFFKKAPLAAGGKLFTY